MICLRDRTAHDCVTKRSLDPPLILKALWLVLRSCLPPSASAVKLVMRPRQPIRMLRALMCDWLPGEGASRLVPGLGGWGAGDKPGPNSLNNAQMPRHLPVHSPGHCSRNARAMLSRIGRVRYSKNVRSLVVIYTSAGMPGVGLKPGMAAASRGSSAIRAR